MSIKTLCIVPARSGSKGITDKNIRVLGQYPLLAWTAQAITAAKVKNMLAILSTDSETYAEIGKTYGLTVPFIRPEAYSTDQSGTLDVVKHALNWFEKTYDYEPEQIMVLQPTSPFRKAEVINNALSLMENNNSNAIIGCKAIFRDLTTLFTCSDGYLIPLDNRSDTQTQRQAVEPLLTPDGSMYLIKTKTLQQYQSFYPPYTIPLMTSKITHIDIDDEEDWQIAEGIINHG